MQTTVSHIVELQEPLHDQVARFLDNHPEWDSYRLFNTAVLQFLLQNEQMENPDQAAKLYVQNMFSLVRAQKNGHQSAP